MKWDREYWDKTWLRNYDRYDRHHREIWEAVLPYLKGKVCDLGCGTASMYIGSNFDLIGVDWSKEALNEARLNYPQGNYLCASVTDTCLPEAYFDTVVMFGLLDYFEDWTPVIEEARRIVKPNGIIIGTLLNKFNGHDWEQYPHLIGNWHLIKIPS